MRKPRKRPLRSLSRGIADFDSRRAATLRAALLRWAGHNGRHFFWREPGIRPYDVLVSEILLAKTRAELAAPVALKLLARYPTPRDLADARTGDLQRILFPLGLHRKRARHLVACAKTLIADFNGVVPPTIAQLVQLPFVGRYAAHAIACVAFDAQVAVLDANVARVYGRVYSLPPPPARLANAHDLWALADRLLPRKRAKEFNWAILDLGGTVCTAKAPACERCPIINSCDHGRSFESETPLA